MIRNVPKGKCIRKFLFTRKRKNEMTLLKIRSTLFRFAVILSASSLEKSDRLSVKSTFTVMAASAAEASR